MAFVTVVVELGVAVGVVIFASSAATALSRCEGSRLGFLQLLFELKYTFVACGLVIHYAVDLAMSIGPQATNTVAWYNLNKRTRIHITHFDKSRVECDHVGILECKRSRTAFPMYHPVVSYASTLFVDIKRDFYRKTSEGELRHYYCRLPL